MPRKALKSEVAADIRAVFSAPQRQEAEELLAFAVRKYAKIAGDLPDWMEENIPEGLTVFSFPENIVAACGRLTVWNDAIARFVAVRESLSCIPILLLACAS